MLEISRTHEYGTPVGAGDVEVSTVAVATRVVLRAGPWAVGYRRNAPEQLQVTAPGGSTVIRIHDPVWALRTVMALLVVWRWWTRRRT